jgi:hypothetical protein
MVHDFGIFGDPSIIIPPGISFAALKLQSLPGGAVSLDYSVLAQVWVENGLPSDLLGTSTTLDILTFVAIWYAEHTRSGGAIDPMHAELVAHLLGKKTTMRRILPM